jgi:hypothetical protein
MTSVKEKKAQRVRRMMTKRTNKRDGKAMPQKGSKEMGTQKFT